MNGNDYQQNHKSVQAPLYKNRESLQTAEIAVIFQLDIVDLLKPEHHVT
jgi:hypothetical protein